MPSGNLLAGFPDYGAELPEERLVTGRHLFPTPGTPGWSSSSENGAAAKGRRGRHEPSGHRHPAQRRRRGGRPRAAVRPPARARPGAQGRGVRLGWVRARRGARAPLHPRSHLRHLRDPRGQGDFVRLGSSVGAKLREHGQRLVEAGASHSGVALADTAERVDPLGRRHDARQQVRPPGGRREDALPRPQQGPRGVRPDQREYPNLALFMIYDHTVASSESWAGMRQPMPLPGRVGGVRDQGRRLGRPDREVDGELAGLVEHTGGLRLDPAFKENLAETIERFNGFAESGVDADFGRGQAPIGRAWNGPNREGSPNPTMAPFASEGPCYCVIVVCGMLDTNGGPVTDTGARVLDFDDNPIPGLYGAGNCVASPAGQGYWGPGATIGLGITYGHLAGPNAAAEPEKGFTY
ncbi:MAG: FAD-binding protein [Microthrixaceae bacterium]|nr:FAD-binding protein [Microthrixaceae bacterium]